MRPLGLAILHLGLALARLSLECSRFGAQMVRHTATGRSR